MGYRLDRKDIKITGKRLTKIGNGTTGNVYRYKNMALKIFNQDKGIPITPETASYLTSISTSRVLLPKNLLFFNHQFKGYTYKLVHKKGCGRTILTLPKDELIGNIAIMERDIERLSKKQVLLNGIAPENSIFNGHLYLTDPSRYSILDIFSTEELERLNKFQLHLLLTTLITSEIRKTSFESSHEAQVKELLDIRDVNENSSDFFADIMTGNDNIAQLIKKI